MDPAVSIAPVPINTSWPDHTQLPETDGSIVENFQEAPQGALFTGCMMPVLNRLYPDGRFAVGQDSGIYFHYTEPVLDGCKSPDWFLIPGVDPMLDGVIRRSYVLWREGVRPLIVIEYVSGDGSEEHDRTPYKGKFWVYERGIGATYYAIFDGFRNTLELYAQNGDGYHQVPANEAGRYPVPPLGIELGLWFGTFQHHTCPWLRAWDAETGIMLPSYDERAEAERKKAEAERKKAEAERKKAEAERKKAESERERAETAESLLDDARERLEGECERAESERRRADQERQRAEQLLELLRAAGIALPPEMG